MYNYRPPRCLLNLSLLWFYQLWFWKDDNERKTVSCITRNFSVSVGIIWLNINCLCSQLSCSHNTCFLTSSGFLCPNHCLLLQSSLQASAKDHIATFPDDYVRSLCCTVLGDNYLVSGQLMQLSGSGPMHFWQDASHNWHFWESSRYFPGRKRFAYFRSTTHIKKTPCTKPGWKM